MEDYITKEELEYSCEAVDFISYTRDNAFKEEERYYFYDDFKKVICNQLAFGVDIYNMLKECGMDVESLKHIKEDEIKELFPTRMMGTRIKFRIRVSQWQKNEPIKRVRVMQNAIHTEKDKSMFGSGLAQILEARPRGRGILNFYAENGKLLDEHREILISIIVEHCIDHSMAMSTRDVANFAKEIGEIFPLEDTRYYYNARKKGLNPSGKLYSRATNARRKVKKNITSVSNPDENIPEETTIVEPIFQTYENEAENKEWLLHNTEPWEDVLIKWHETFNLRRADVLNKDQNVLEAWPLLKHAMGYNLVEMDYAKLFPEREHGLVSEWENFRENVIPFIREKVKDGESRKLMEKIKGNTCTDSIDCIIILLLHAVIKPPFVSITKPSLDNKKFKWKPSISEAQNATVLHCTSLSEYKEKFETFKANALERCETAQPLLLVIGEDITKLESFYVLHDDILYQLPTFVKSLDILFKFYQVTNFKYPSEARYLYELIESYFFKMNTSCNPNIISLTKYFDDKKIHIIE